FRIRSSSRPWTRSSQAPGPARSETGRFSSFRSKRCIGSGRGRRTRRPSPPLPQPADPAVGRGPFRPKFGLRWRAGGLRTALRNLKFVAAPSSPGVQSAQVEEFSTGGREGWEVREALFELQRYLSDQIAPLMVVDEVEILAGQPPELTATEIRNWTAE